MVAVKNIYYWLGWFVNARYVEDSWLKEKLNIVEIVLVRILNFEDLEVKDV
jgi:hypothetical protein